MGAEASPQHMGPQLPGLTNPTSGSFQAAAITATGARLGAPLPRPTLRSAPEAAARRLRLSGCSSVSSSSDSCQYQSSSSPSDVSPLPQSSSDSLSPCQASEPDITASPAADFLAAAEPEAGTAARTNAAIASAVG